jgi:putative inorganic carbon (hco3(-)) transporter
MAFYIYLLLTTSWFIRLCSRIEFLGAIRFDFILFVILGIMSLNVKLDQRISKEGMVRYLWVLLFYVVFTIPLVQWPGSVVKIGLPNLLKVLLFFVFTLKFIRSEKQLKAFIAVLLSCQLFRVLEPLYLHLTKGYWGSKASMAGWTSMERLAGAPHDIINPNGLALVCLITLPFLYYYRSISKWNHYLFLTLTPVILYCLALTGSRSGMVGLFILLLAVSIKSNKKILLPILISIALVISFQRMGGNLQDRYISLFDESAGNAVTVQNRIDGLYADLEVALKRPIAGHGLGTSKEANYNFRGKGMLSHNLLLEIAQELGLVGLIIFIFYLRSILLKIRSLSITLSPKNSFLGNTSQALEVWFYMYLVFGMASYGLSVSYWYLFPALILKTAELGLAQEETLYIKSTARVDFPLGRENAYGNHNVSIS